MGHEVVHDLIDRFFVNAIAIAIDIQLDRFNY